jgi:hypothetical protein
MFCAELFQVKLKADLCSKADRQRNDVWPELRKTATAQNSSQKPAKELRNMRRALQ